MGVNFTPLITPLNLMKIQIENHNDLLRLRWDNGDKRQTLAIGVNDSPLGRTRKRATKAVARTKEETGNRT
jgi:hypothetical protein